MIVDKNYPKITIFTIVVLFHYLLTTAINTDLKTQLSNTKLRNQPIRVNN